MTQQRDIERLLDLWFSDGPDQAPDRVVDIVTDRIERQSQRPAWRLQRRPFPVNAYAKLAVAAAAVLIVAVVGYNLLPGRSTGVGGAGFAGARHLRQPRRLRHPPRIADALCTRRGSRQRQRAEPASCRRAARRPRPSRPASRSRCRRAGSTPAMRPISTGCSRTRPPMQAEVRRLRGPRPGDLHGAACEPVFRLRCVGGQSGRRRPRWSPPWWPTKPLRRPSRSMSTIGGLTGKQIDVQLDPGWTDSCPGDPPTLDLGDHADSGDPSRQPRIAASS